MPTALITGVTGFTGRYLAPKLAQAGYEVHGTVHGDSDESVEGVSKLHRVDLGDADSVSRLVRDTAASKVVHLAAIAFVAHKDAAEMYRSNILGTRNLLDALTNAAATPDAVLIASSANIYGNAREGVLDESVPAAPANDYGVTKAAAELLAGVYANRLPLIVARPFNYTGRGQSEQFLIPKIVSHVRRHACQIELGNLDVARDFSDVRGVVDAYEQLLETPSAIGETVNICSGKATSLRELLDLTRNISGRELDVRVNPAFVRSDEVKTLCGSPRKVESLIGPLAMPSLEETLRWMLAD